MNNVNISFSHLCFMYDVIINNAVLNELGFERFTEWAWSISSLPLRRATHFYCYWYATLSRVLWRCHLIEFSLFSRLRANDALNYFNNVFSAGRECCQGFFFARGGFPVFIYNTSMRLRRSFTYIIVRSGYLAFCVPHTALLFVHCPDSVAKKQRTTTGRWLLAI